MIKSILAIVLLLPLFLSAQKNTPKNPEEVVALMKENVTCDWQTETVDVFKAGNPQSNLRGIAVCMFADVPTLQKAVELGCNFIITHEPVFYNHLDETENLLDNAVFKEKMDYIQKHKLVVFRYHDHIHATKPDGIYQGMIDQLNLESYALDGSLIHYKLPQQSVAEYGESLKKALGLETIRVIGNPEMKFTNMALMVGAPGGQRHISMLNRDDVEVLVAGEASEWETYLYANDAVNLGKNKAVIFLGHIKSEEAGMKYCTKWLKSFVSGVPIHFIENKPNFTTL